MNIHSHLSSTVHKKFAKAQRCNREHEILSIEQKYNVGIRLLETDLMILAQENLLVLVGMVCLEKI